MGVAAVIEKKAILCNAIVCISELVGAGWSYFFFPDKLFDVLQFLPDFSATFAKSDEAPLLVSLPLALLLL